MQKVLKMAALIAGLAAVSCSNPALRESPAPQAERAAGARTYTIVGIYGFRVRRSGRVEIRSEQRLTYAGYPALVCSKSPEPYAERLARAAGVTSQRDEGSHSGWGKYVTKDGELLFGWNFKGSLLYVSPKYYAVLE